MTTQGPRKSEAGGESREGILDVAERLIATRGFDSMRMATLIKESGHSASSIYWWFGSKEGVLEAVMERATERFFAGAAGLALPEDQIEIVDRMETFLGESLARTIAEPNYLRLFMLQALLRDVYDPSEQGTVAKVRDAATSNIALGLEAVLQPWGPEPARHVAATIAAPTLIAFDGAFLHSQVGGQGIGGSLLRQLAIALTAMAEAAQRF